MLATHTASEIQMEREWGDQKEIIKNYYSLLIILSNVYQRITEAAYTHYGNVYFVVVMVKQMSGFIWRYGCQWNMYTTIFLWSRSAIITVIAII